MKRGVWMAVGAYGLWGVLPLYWKLLHAVPALEVLAHRIVWSWLLVAAVLALQSRRSWLRELRGKPKAQLAMVGSALLLGANWYLYIWAVMHNYVVEASLGYFINPLFSVVLGVVLLRERLRRGQWLAVGIAAAGVLYLTAIYGRLPWVGLTLVLTFGVYGYMKKIAPLGALEGLLVETGILGVPLLAYLVWLEVQGGGAFWHWGAGVTALLVVAGPVTALPMVLFVAGARQINLSLVGMLQYIAPTLQFLIGVLVFHEYFNPARLLGFGVIWLALVVFSVEGALRGRRVPAVSRP